MLSYLHPDSTTCKQKKEAFGGIKLKDKGRGDKVKDKGQTSAI